MGNEQSKASSADNDSQSNTTASTRPTSHSSSASSGIILGAAGAQNPEPSAPLPKLNPKHPREPIKMFHSRQHQHPHPQNMSAHQQPLNAHYQGQTFVDLTDSDPEDDLEDDPKNDSEDEAMSEEHAPRDFDDGHFAAALNALEDRNRHEEQQAQVPPRMDSPHDRLEGIYDPPHPPPQQVAQANIQQDPDAFIQGEIYDLPHRAEWQDPAAGNVLWNIEDEDLDLQRYLHSEVMAAPQRRLAQEQAESAPQHEQTPRGVETQLDCINAVAQFFPGICRDYVTELYNTISQSSDTLIPHILDKHENGAPWPKAKEKQNILKRKREADEDEEAIRRYTAADRGAPHGAHVYVRACLQAEFDFTPMNFIDSVLRQNKNHLFPCYRILEEAERTWDDGRPPYNKLKKRRDNQRPHLDKSKPANLEQYLQQKPPEFIRDPVERDILTELQAARKFRQKADEKRQMKRQAELEEDLNLAKAQVEGTMSECGCCWGDFPLNRMVHCDNEEVLHWFCRGCAKQTAENEIGNSKYELHCMSMDDCEGGFSNDQRKLFLDENAIVALGRNEQEAVLRMAGIENLASCPFCPYAAEYPPVEVNRVFQCAAPDCEKASCRLCKLESHIPKSCEENAKETGLSIRRQIEEAMSAALIRTCNKCGTPFVKDEGCNKMTCTRNGCRNVQCYVCSKSCDYDHFNDTRRGGKVGNCPLFEDVSQRHDNEVQKAEKEAMERVRAEHPEYTEEDLKVKMSENVAKDDQRRKENDPILRANQHMQQMQQMYAQYPDMRPMHRPRKYIPLNVGPREAPVPLGDMFLDLVDDEDDEAEAQEIQAFLREVHQRNAAGQGLPLPVSAVDGENRARRARERLAAAQRGLGKIQNQAIENRGPRLAFIERLRNGRGNPAVAPVDGPIPAAGPPASQPVEPQHPARQHAFPEHLVLRQQLGPHQQGLFPLNEWILFGNAGEGNAQQVNVPQRPEREGGQLQAMRAQLRRLPPQPVVANQNARPEINQRIPAQLLASQAAMAQAHQMRIDAILRRQQRQQEDLEGFEEWL